MKRHTHLLIVALLMTGTQAVISQVVTEPTVTIIDHVDIIPDSYQPGTEEKAAAILRAQTAASLHDIGMISYAVFQQNDASNHFTIVETWKTQKAYEAHEGSPHTIEFRNRIQPLLGGPFDSRAHHPFQ